MCVWADAHPSIALDTSEFIVTAGLQSNWLVHVAAALHATPSQHAFSAVTFSAAAISTIDSIRSFAILL